MSRFTAAGSRPSVRLRAYDNSWFHPGRSFPLRAAWLLASRVFFVTSIPWPSGVKAFILRMFGAEVGARIVLKPRVTIKYPWRLRVGTDCWIGEGVWLDNLGEVELGNDCCLSQRAFVETGSHDRSDPRFGLVVRPVKIESSSWIAADALVLPGSVVGEGAVVGAGAVLSGPAQPWTVYRGNPAVPVCARRLRDAGDESE